MTNTQSTPAGGPITARELAAELGTDPVTVELSAQTLEGERPRRASVVYLAYRERLLSGEAADLIRGMLPADRTHTVGTLASELGLSTSQVERSARDLERVLSAGDVHAAVWADGRLTPYAVERIRASAYGRTHIGISPEALALELGTTPEEVRTHTRSLLAERRLIVWLDRDVISTVAANEIRAAVRGRRAERHVNFGVYHGRRSEDPGLRAARRMMATYEGDRDPETTPVPVDALARELELSAHTVTVLAQDLARRYVTTWTPDGLLTPDAVERIRAGALPPAATEDGPTLDGLARELDVSMSTAAMLVTDAGTPLRNAWYGGERIPSDVADRARALHRERSATAAPEADSLGYAVDALYDGGAARCRLTGAHGPHRGASSMTVSGVEHATAWRCDGRAEPAPDMVRVASLLIRQDMELVDSDTDAAVTAMTGDPDIMAWAVATAGHLFDQHDLWDYDLVTNAEHVHRCYDHRHDGDNTRGVDRG